MKQYANDDLGVSFALKEEFTVREMLNFRSRIWNVEVEEGDGFNIRYWMAARPLIQDWECEAIPDPMAFDLDSAGSWRLANIVGWVSDTVAAHIAELDDVPKNT